MTIVLDASVIIKWILPEVDSDKADKLKHFHENEESVIHIPNLLYYELINTLSHIEKIPLEEIDIFLKAIEKLNLKEECFNFDDYREIGHLARHYVISGYDASYVYLAQKLNTQLITADEKLYQKTKKSNLVRLL